MKRLSDAVKRRIVEHLACYRTHAEIVDLIAEEFDVAVTPRHVRAYDPMCFQFAGGPKWCDYFTAARKRFESEIAEIPIAHRAYRLRKLGQILDKELERGNTVGARATLEQAAKEVGNVYTNVSRVQGSGVVAHVLTEVERTPEERRNMLADRLSEAIERMSKPKKITEH